MEFNADVFDRGSVEVLAGRLVRFLDVVAADASVRVSAVDVLAAGEFERIVRGWNDTAVEVEAGSGVGVEGLFAACVAGSPDAVAVCGGGVELTYRELDERANRVANRLRGLGVVAETPVAVWMERSVDVVVASLGVLKAGGVYVPLHGGYPAERRAWIVEAVGAPVVLVDRARLALGVPDGPAVVVVDDEDGFAGVGAEDPGVVCAPDQLAYVMFTSGSTGMPKGVGVSHRAIAERVRDRIFTSGAHERVLMVAPYAFDPSTYAMWVPLLGGGCVVVAPEGRVEVDTLRRLLVDGRVTGLDLTAGLFRVVAEEDPSVFATVREVLTGGDVISPTAVRRVIEHCPNTTVRTTYGATEMTFIAVNQAIDGSPRPGPRCRSAGPWTTRASTCSTPSSTRSPPGSLASCTLPAPVWLGGMWAVRS